MDNGKVTHYMAIRFDISESKKLEKMLEKEQKINQLTTHLATIGEMSTGIMHEINNPLAIIGFHLDYIHMQIEKGELETSKLLHSLSKMRLGVKRASKITTSLRSLSKFDENEKDKNVNLKKLIDETLDLCIFKIKKHDVEIKLKKLTKIESVFSKSMGISQILINLINNGIDAIEKLEERWVKIILEETDHSLKISVQDSGGGIDPEVVDQMMNAFYTTKEKGKGTGVGLSLCMHLASQLSGEVYYNDSFENTTFTLELPLVKDIMGE
jgi:C4-dicarboxylate-specific signal transduction histidine kinase